MTAKPPIKKRAPRTIKEKKFVKEYIDNGGNGTRAALAVYDTDDYHTAASIAGENLKKLELEDYFTAAKLTKETMAQNIARIALTSTKLVSANIVIKQDGEVIKADGRTNDFIEIPDDDQQRKAMEFAAKLVSWYAPPRAPVDEKGETVTPIYALPAE